MEEVGWRRFSEGGVHTTEEEKMAILKLKEITRSYLDKEFPNSDSVTVYRGLKFDAASEIVKQNKVGDKVDLQGNNISSWTLDKSVADKVSKTYTKENLSLKMEIPKDDILLHYKVGKSNHPAEKEITVLGGKHTAEVVKVD